MTSKLGRKLYSIFELYGICYEAMRTIRYLSKAKKRHELSDHFIERIMLAVTEVNGCAICSYAHSKMALEAGMSNEEIQKMLAGVMTDTPSEEMSAVMFAQYYAESRGKPSKEAWERILNLYGETKALGILGAIRIIMLGNAYGIPWSSFLGRFKGKPDARSHILYEVGVMVIGSLLLPVAIIHAGVSNLLKVPLDTF